MPRCGDPCTPRTPRDENHESSGPTEMPQCGEPCAAQTPRGENHEPVCLTTPGASSSTNGSGLKRALLSIAQGQHDALQLQLELQHDSLRTAINKLLMADFDAKPDASLKGDTLESSISENGRLNISITDAEPLLVTPAATARPRSHVSTRSGASQIQSMCDLKVTEMLSSANHDISVSRKDLLQSKTFNAPLVAARWETLKQKWSQLQYLVSLPSRVARRSVKGGKQVQERMERNAEVGEGLFNRLGGIKIDSCIGFAILINTIVLCVQLQWHGYEAGVQIGVNRQDGSWEGSKGVFDILEHIFNGLFVAELILRLFIFRLGFFLEFGNVFDLALVLITSIELYILSPLETSIGSNVSFLRVIRLAKLVRVLRLVRVFKLFRQLRVLLATIAASVQALVWSMILICVIIVIVGIFMCQLLQTYILDDSSEDDNRSWAFQFYGNPPRSIYTVFEATLSGCWPNYARPLVENFSPWYAVIYILYITGVNFAVVRIITALFLRETLLTATNDADVMVQEQLHVRQALINKLGIFFSEADQSGDGLIDFQEFTDIMQNPKVKTWLSCLEFEVHEATALFHMLDDGDGLITYDEFCKGVLRLKGHARSIDIIAIMHDVNVINKEVQALQNLIISGQREKPVLQAEWPSTSAA